MLRIALITAMLATSLPALSQDYRGGTPEDYREIEQFHDRSVARNNADDVPGAISDYLPRLRVLNTASKTIKGRADLEASWSATSQSSQRPVLLSEIQEMEVNGNQIGDWAYIICRYAYVSVDRETGAVTSEFQDGRYLALLEKTADGWKVLLDIDNGAPGAAPDMLTKLRRQVAP